MTQYAVNYIYSRVEDDTIYVDADSPEEAERLAAEEIEEDGLDENCYLERYRAQSYYTFDAAGNFQDDIVLDPERPYIEVGEPTIEVEIDGLLTVVNKPRGVNLVITGMTPGLFDSDTRVVDSKFEKVSA